jgi:hypothetical protein
MRRGKFQGMIWAQTPIYIHQHHCLPNWQYVKTYGLLADVVELVGWGVNHLTLDLVCPATIVPQATGAAGHVSVPGHAECLAVVQSLNRSKEVGVLLEELGELHEELSTVLGCLLSPWAVEGFAGSGDGEVDILLRCLLDSADDLLGGGVDDVEGLAIDGLYELIVDKPGQVLVRYIPQCTLPRISDMWRRTYRPVGWSYSPVWGVLSFTERPDMIEGVLEINWGICRTKQLGENWGYWWGVEGASKS